MVISKNIGDGTARIHLVHSVGATTQGWGHGGFREIMLQVPCLGDNRHASGRGWQVTG